jgi:hypothetical protein
MKRIKFYSIPAFMLGLSILLTSCPSNSSNPFPNSASDTTAPGFLQVVVRLESATPPTLRGEFDITSQDVSKTELDSSLKMRLIATAGDSESGIRSIVIVSNLTWQCSLGPNSEIIGIVENSPVAFTAITQPASPATPFQINVTVDPVAQTGCDLSTPGKGPVNFGGYVRVVVTNGNGLTNTSNTFIFDYRNIGSF